MLGFGGRATPETALNSLFLRPGDQALLDMAGFAMPAFAKQVTKASSVELAGVVVYPCTGIHLVKKLPGKKRVPHLNRSETQDLRWGWGGGPPPPPPPHLTSP